MAGELDAQRLAAKRWNQRNSDGKFSFGDEEGRQRDMQSPPSFEEDTHELPTGTVRLSNPDDSEDARAIRHTHTFDPIIVEPV